MKPENIAIEMVYDDEMREIQNLDKEVKYVKHILHESWKIIVKKAKFSSKQIEGKIVIDFNYISIRGGIYEEKNNFLNENISFSDTTKWGNSLARELMMVDKEVAEKMKLAFKLKYIESS